jgi:hypothetical protein
MRAWTASPAYSACDLPLPRPPPALEKIGAIRQADRPAPVAAPHTITPCFSNRTRFGPTCRFPESDDRSITGLPGRSCGRTFALNLPQNWMGTAASERRLVLVFLFFFF